MFSRAYVVSVGSICKGYFVETGSGVNSVGAE